MRKIFQLLPGALLLSVALLGLACNRLQAVANQSNAASGATASGAPAAAPPVSDNPEDKMPRVKVQDAMKEVADGTAVIIDVRGTDAYKLAHIKGAMDVPLTKLEGKDFNSVPKGKRIIAYCTWPNEHTSARAAFLLDQNGFKNSGALLGGMFAWEAAGGGMEKAPAEPAKK